MGMEFFCETCGRRFQPPAGEIMKFCSYCGKPVKLVQTQDPDIIPLAEDAPAAGEVRVPPVVVPPVVAAPPGPPAMPSLPPPIPSAAPPAPPAVPPVFDDAPPVPPVPVGTGDDFELRPLTPPAPRGDTFAPPHASLETPAETPGPSSSDPAGWQVEEPAPVAAAPSELDLREAVDSSIALEATKCPNCGQSIPAGAEICTGCGYSRRLGRTLTTRVGSPEIPRHRPATEEAPKSDQPAIAAERDYDLARQRKMRIAGGGDTFRLLIGLFFTLVFAGVLMTLPLNYLREPAVFLPWRVPELVDGQFIHAALLLALFLVIIVPITTIGVRIGIALTAIESPLYLTFVRVAGTLSAVLLTAGIVFAADSVVFKLEPRWFYVALGVEAGLALLVFTWYLQNVRFAGAMALWIYTLVFLAIGVFAAGAAYSPLAKFAGIGNPWVPPVGQWFGNVDLPG